MLIAVVACGGDSGGISTPTGFTRLTTISTYGDLRLSLYYRQAAPPQTSVTVNVDYDQSIQLRLLEYSGMAQANVVDVYDTEQDYSYHPHTHSPGPTTQNDELVLSFLVNQNATTTQSGFTGGFVRLFESTSPSSFQHGSPLHTHTNQDWERTRYTLHQLVTTTTGNYEIYSNLSTDEDWLAVTVAFKGGSSGPARFSSTKATATKAITVSGTGTLTVFGPLKSTVTAPANPAIRVTGSGRVLPFDYQFLLPNGLIIGAGTPYTVVSHDGLYGYQVRSSDEDQPRGDGALRGIDLQSARQALFKIQVAGTRPQIESNLDELYRALVPQRERDWQLIWRHPAQPVKLLNCRAIELPREIDQRRALAADQAIVLRAADPRHYSAIPRRVIIPVTPAGATPLTTQVFNSGNIAAHPVISIQGPTSGPPVTRLTLVNATARVTFGATLVLANGSTLTGDMYARITGAPRSVVTLDGQSKYGSWQLPREPFRIDPDPSGLGGYNLLYLQTEPAGAPVICTLEYRDTWSG